MLPKLAKSSPQAKRNPKLAKAKVRVTEEFRKVTYRPFILDDEMGTLANAPVIPLKLKPIIYEHKGNIFSCARGANSKHRNRALAPMARLFGPAIFEASKLKVLILGVDEKIHPGKLPRTYTLTHNDITSKLTLAISQSVNNCQIQGWNNRLQRDEVVAEWKKFKGEMSLHVHCHISGGHFLLDIFARLRYYIFQKELPVVLKAFAYGDGNLLNNYPELQEALVWVYFHSNISEFDKVECWGPLRDTKSPCSGIHKDKRKINSTSYMDLPLPKPCSDPCNCCFPPEGSNSTPLITGTSQLH